MTKPPLGRLEKVNLREYWEREDVDFTPWLAEEENIALLGEAIDLELEVQEQEANVGPFRADILCRNTGDNSFVLVENQLGRTDHSHLGQLLTYAAGLNAVTLVWVVARFTEEHRAALDWLNRITDEGFHFFGLEVELWRIGESVLAPKFNLVAKPNDWSKTVRELATTTGQLTEAARLKSDFWGAFAKYMEDQGSPLRPPKANPSNWQGWGIGKSYFLLCALVNLHAVYLNLSGPNAEAHYQLLRDQREEIEDALGFKLEWKKGPNQRNLVLRREGDTTDQVQWPEQHRWLLSTLLKFDQVFRPLVKKIDATDWVGEGIQSD